MPAGAAHKLPFHVVHATSEDPDYPATDLNYNGPTRKGWLSARNCDWPQDVGFQFDEGMCSCVQIQLLSHQYAIATKIELFTGIGDSYATAKWKRLGYLSLDSNKRSNYRSRELKSVFVDAKGQYIKVVMHRCYSNEENLRNQVGIVAISFLGSVGGRDLGADMRMDPDTAAKLERERAVTGERLARLRGELGQASVCVPGAAAAVGSPSSPSAASSSRSTDECKESGSGATMGTEEVARLHAAMAAKHAAMREKDAAIAAKDAAMREKEVEMVEMQVLLTCRVEHFEVLRAVGGGQNGMVFAVRCLRDGIPRAAKEYALKIVFNFGAGNTAGRNLYEAEFAVQSQLPPHHHLLRFWAEFYDRIPDTMMAHLPEVAREQAEYRDRRSGEMVRRRAQFIVTDYHPETLESKLAGLAMPLPYATAVKYTEQLLQGVAHMHKHRVVHLDLKLDNILVADDSRLVICDFGTAYRFKSEDMTLPVSPGMSVGGNQLHLAPEVLNAFNAAQRGDSEDGVCYAKQAMWAVGSLVHEMVLGSPPFLDYPHAYRRGGYRVDVEGEELAELPEAYPDTFKSLVRSMLHGDPVKRCECEAALALVEVLAKSL